MATTGMMNPSAGMEKVVPYSVQDNSQKPLATTYLFTGPTSGSNGVASTAFTVSLASDAANSVIETKVTPADSGTGTAGAFSKSYILLNKQQTSGTFTYTPGSTGDKVISVTNNSGTRTDGTQFITNPASITYTSS